MSFCENCGITLPYPSTSPQCPQCGYPRRGATSPLNLSIATVLCFFLGGLGVHRFYAGKIVTAIIMLLTLGGFGIWTAIDLIYLICGKFTDSKGFPINYIGAPRLAIVLICIFLFIVLALIVFTVYGIYVI